MSDGHQPAAPVRQRTILPRTFFGPLCRRVPGCHGPPPRRTRVGLPCSGQASAFGLPAPAAAAGRRADPQRGDAAPQPRAATLGAPQRGLQSALHGPARDLGRQRQRNDFEGSGLFHQRPGLAPGRPRPGVLGPAGRRHPATGTGSDALSQHSFRPPGTVRGARRSAEQGQRRTFLRVPGPRGLFQRARSEAHPLRSFPRTRRRCHR